jgi:hypothetical protein
MWFRCSTCCCRHSNCTQLKQENRDVYEILGTELNGKITINSLRKEDEHQCFEQDSKPGGCSRN